MIDSELLTATFTKSSSSGGGGGGGGSSSTSSIAAGNGVSVNYTQSGNNLTLDLNTSKINEIVNQTQNKTAVFNLSGAKNVTSAIMPVQALNQLAAAKLAVEIMLPQGTITLNNDAAQSIADQIKGGNVSISLNEVSFSSLTAEQSAAVKPEDLVFNISISAGSEQITNFDGTITVCVPYDGPLPAAVWYLNDAGNMEKMDSTYDEKTGKITFTTNHLSLYVVGPLVEVATRISLVIGSRSYTVDGIAKSMDVAPEILLD